MIAALEIEMKKAMMNPEKFGALQSTLVELEEEGFDELEELEF